MTIVDTETTFDDCFAGRSDGFPFNDEDLGVEFRCVNFLNDVEEDEFPTTLMNFVIDDCGEMSGSSSERFGYLDVGPEIDVHWRYECTFRVNLFTESFA
jgi:hypothetical protein